MLHSDWFTLMVFISVNVSFFDMMQGDNGNIREVLGLASFTDYLFIHLIYHCIIVFCLYSTMALYNTKLQEILKNVKTALQASNPEYDLVIDRIHPYYDMQLITFGIDKD